VGVPVTAGATYKLDVFVGSRLEGFAAHYLVELLAGSTVLGSASGIVAPGTGNFFNVEVTAVGAGSGDLSILLSETGKSQTFSRLSRAAWSTHPRNRAAVARW
jgi:hypothetical protein